MIIIGFTGKKENGKSTVCEMIADELKHQFFIALINFKDPLVTAAKSLGWNGVKDQKGRRGLQLLGTDVVRECFDPDHWVKAWKSTVQNETIGFDIVLTDDVRFDNEAEAVKSVGGKIVYIESPGKNLTRDTHISEAGIDPKYIDRLFLSVPVGLNHLRSIARTIINDIIRLR